MIFTWEEFKKGYMWVIFKTKEGALDFSNKFRENVNPEKNVIDEIMEDADYNKDLFTEEYLAVIVIGEHSEEYNLDSISVAKKDVDAFKSKVWTTIWEDTVIDINILEEIEKKAYAYARDLWSRDIRNTKDLSKYGQHIIKDNLGIMGLIYVNTILEENWDKWTEEMEKDIGINRPKGF